MAVTPTPTVLSEVGICNLALSLIGITEPIASLDEKSKAAVQCRLHYPLVRDSLLRSLAWPFAEKYAALSLSNDPLLADNSEPFPGWMYSYTYPADCLLARHVCDSGGIRLRYVQMDALYYDLLQYVPPKVPFKVARGASGKVLLCDLQNAYCIYTMNLTDPTQFDPLYATAVAGALAARISAGMRVDAGLVQNALGVMVQAARDAQAQAYNESQEDQEPPSKSIQSRM